MMGQLQPLVAQARTNMTAALAQAPGLVLSEETSPLLSIGYRGLEPHLVVTAAGAAMRHGAGPLHRGHPDEMPGHDRPAEGIQCRGLDDPKLDELLPAELLREFREQALLSRQLATIELNDVHPCHRITRLGAPGRA